MKNIIITVIIIFSAYAKSNCSQSNNNTFVIDIFLKAENAVEDINLADQNYRFSYDNLAINNPEVLPNGSDLMFDQMVSSGNGNQALFVTPDLNGSEPGIVSLNIRMPGGNGYNLSSSTLTYICSVQFEVSDATLPIGFDWHEEDQFPPTYLSSFNNNSLIQVNGIYNNNLQPNVQDHFTSAVSASDFDRDWMHVCTVNDGSLEVSWNANVYDDIYISIDGGRTFTATTGDSFSASNLPAYDYDIRVKEGENGCPIALEDINIRDLSHEVERSWGHPNCGENDGWIELTWLKKALNNIDISIDGGLTYTRVPAADEFYRVDSLTTGNYDIRVKWDYAPYACPTVLDDVNLGVAKPANSGLRASYHCTANDQLYLRLREVVIDADTYRFQYRTKNGGWSAWKNTAITTNGSRNILNINPNITAVQYRVRVSCDGKWSGWGYTKTFTSSPPACRLSNDIDDNSINVYPNPANELVSVDIAGDIAKGSTVSIYNVAGKQVQANALMPEQKSIQLDVEGLTNGIYLIEVNTGDKNYTQKLTIAH